MATAEPMTHRLVGQESTWTTVVWDDPVNLMDYVTMVFMRYFGYPRERAACKQRHQLAGEETHAWLCFAPYRPRSRVFAQPGGAGGAVLDNAKDEEEGGKIQQLQP